MTPPVQVPPARDGRAAKSVLKMIARRTLWPVYLFYYRVLYASRLPGATASARFVLALEARVGRGDTPIAKEVWEEKYRAGKWEFMRDLFEVPRYASIAAVAHRVRPNPAILDVGCGEGLLQRHLRALGYQRYLGIDVAETAIAQASPRVDERTAFDVADAESFAPAGQFDVIVFNECVHYFRHPTASVAAYEKHLAPEGVFIISVFRTPRGNAIVRGLLQRYDVVEEFAISHRRGTSIVCVVTPRAVHPQASAALRPHVP